MTPEKREVLRKISDANPESDVFKIEMPIDKTIEIRPFDLWYDSNEEAEDLREFAREVWDAAVQWSMS